MGTIRDLIINYGLDTFVIAICTVAVTGIIKIPIKILSHKTQNSKKITRFITFLPIIFGFGLTVLDSLILKGNIDFNQSFFEQWLCAVSLSLAVYAIWEQFVPSAKKILSDAEIKANQELIETLNNRLLNNQDTNKLNNTDANIPTEQAESVHSNNRRKIILTNYKNN